VETNEQMKRMLREAVQEELERFFEAVDEIAEGQLEPLEKQVVPTSQQLGRTLLEGVLDSRVAPPASGRPAPGQLRPSPTLGGRTAKGPVDAGRQGEVRAPVLPMPRGG
jgi:hypothetical protein